MNLYKDTNKLNEKKNIDKKLKINFKNTNIVGKEYYNENIETIVLYFKNNKYIYIEQDQKFITARFDLDYKNHEIYELFSNGIENLEDYNYLLNKFGENQLKMRNKRFFIIFLKKIKKIFSLYIFLVVLIWIQIGYQFFWCVIICHLVLILMTTDQKYKNHQKLFNDINLKDPIDIYVKDVLKVRLINLNKLN